MSNNLTGTTDTVAQGFPFSLTGNIEGWYNTCRRHSSFGYLSPNAYETRHNAIHDTTGRQVA